MTKETSPITLPQVYIKIALGIVVMMGILFLPAGTWYWPEAWAFIIGYVAWAFIALDWLWKNDKELLRKRLDWTARSGEGWDRWIMIISSPFYFMLFIVAGLEVRYGTAGFPLWLEIAGYIGLIISVWIIFRVMKENTFLSRIVEIQKTRHHKVITTGPYAFVRHPMYAGVIIMLLSIPLLFGSRYAFIFSGITTIALIIRTVLEDRMLHKELEGYKEYAKKVRWRLIPWIW